MNFAASAFSVFPVRYLGRKTLVVGGHFLMSAVMMLVAYFTIIQWNNTMFSMILLFLFFYQSSDGPVFYIYASEVSTDSGLSLAILSLKFMGLIISLTTSYIVDGLKPQGAFFLFGGLTFLSMIFHWLCMKETRGLNEKEKKSIFMPDDNHETKVY
jgi:hypothetical protein